MAWQASAGLSKSSVIRLNSAAAQPIGASASFDHKWVGRNVENGGHAEHH
jgi:hypothetical protein